MAINSKARVEELEDAIMHLLEVQVRPSSEFQTEWREAVTNARRVLRNKT